MRFLIKSPYFHLIIFFSAILLLQGCGDNPTRNRQPNFDLVPDPYDLSQADTSYTKEGGVDIYIIEQGNTPFEVNPRDQISLHYTGRTEDGEIFESTYANGNIQPAIISNLKPITFRDQRPQIEGFRRGLLGMREGEKRVIMVPDSLGYNDSRPGTNGMDLRDKDLRYDVELVGIQ